MFGFGNKYDRMAKRGDVAALGQLAGDESAATRLLVVEALGKVTNNTDAGTTLVVFLRDPDRKVQLAAVKALGEVGTPAASTHLIRLLTEAREVKDTELEKATDAALKVLRSHT